MRRSGNGQAEGKEAWSRAPQASRSREGEWYPRAPRLSVHRTNAHIYAQVINDVDAATICSASTLDPEFRATGKLGSNKEAAEFVGELVARRALEKGIDTVVFDRSGRLYHGRVKALADGAATRA